MLIEVLLAALAVMLVSLSGVLFLQQTARKFIEENLSFLVSFSAGVFLVTAGALSLEVFELANSVWEGALLISLGYILAWALHKILPETHHHHDTDCHKSHRAARKLIVGDAIHNVADGVVIVVAFTASPTLGLAALASILIHEFLQEMSEFFVLRQAGYSVAKALTINFAVSSTILVGVALGYVALTLEGLEVWLLAISAGFFLSVVIHDLLPKKSHHGSNQTFFKHLVFVLIGVMLMGLISNALSEGHSHGDGEHAEDHEEHDDHI